MTDLEKIEIEEQEFDIAGDFMAITKDMGSTTVKELNNELSILTDNDIEFNDSIDGNEAVMQLREIYAKIEHLPINSEVRQHIESFRNNGLDTNVGGVNTSYSEAMA